MAETLLYIGLDNDDRQKNLDLIETLTGADVAGNFGFKVNLDHALIWGREYIEQVMDRKRPVFVDLKMNNGSRTMSHVVRWLGEGRCSYQYLGACGHEHSQNDAGGKPHRRPATCSGSYFLHALE